MQTPAPHMTSDVDINALSLVGWILFGIGIILHTFRSSFLFDPKENFIKKI
jgi:hypothetical protein